jgi:hypothetical protein
VLTFCFTSYLDHVEDVRTSLLYLSGSTPTSLARLLTSIAQSSRTDEDKLKLVEEKYRAIKREASLQLELAEFKWQHALERDPQMTFDNWIEKYGYDYKDACEERAIAKETLRRAQQTGSRDVLRQKDLMNSSLNSQIEVPG